MRATDQVVSLVYVTFYACAEFGAAADGRFASGMNECYDWDL